MKTKVQTANAPAAIGPYSQAVVVGDLIFTSGQIPLDPETGALIGSDIAEQTHRVCKKPGRRAPRGGRLTAKRRQDGLLPCRYGGFRSLQRSVRYLLHRKARAFLRGGQDPA